MGDPCDGCGEITTDGIQESDGWFCRDCHERFYPERYELTIEGAK
jgi:hypothetical protein